MERPELLNVGLPTDLRKRYRSTQKQLERVMFSVRTGALLEAHEAISESFFNQMLTEWVTEQEYIRECEKNNFSWEKEWHDFSKDADCIL